MINKYYRFRQF